MKNAHLNMILLTGFLSLTTGCTSESDNDVYVVEETRVQLTTDFTGLERPLGVFDLGGNERIPRLDAEGQSLSTSWSIRNTGSGLFTIVAVVDEEELALSLAEQPAGFFIPALSTANNTESQLWEIIPLDNGTCRLSPFLLGSGAALDIVNDDFDVDVVFADSGDFTGQFWSFTQLNGIVFDPAISSCLL